MKNIVVINDLSSIGHCSLMVNIPLLTAQNLNVIPIITSTLSRHSAFNQFYKQDQSLLLKNTIQDIIAHDDPIDIIMIGYLGNPQQVNDIELLLQAYPNAFVFLDPICADQGKLYSSITDEHVQAIKKLLCYANLIKPNLTEMCILTDTPYKFFNPDEILQLINKLRQLTNADILLTGVAHDNQIDNYIITNAMHIISNQYIDKFYPGTGDIFDSIVIGHLFNGHTLVDSVQKAIDYVIQAIHTIDTNENALYGCHIEKLITLKQKD